MSAMRFLPAVAAFAWAGVALSSAQPADAIAIFGRQTGPYATCSSQTTAYSGGQCGYSFNYYQRMATVSIGCNAGGCSAETFAYVDFIYSSGRKPTTMLMSCGFLNGPFYVYSLTSCSC
jgi:hypothetical protein